MGQRVDTGWCSVSDSGISCDEVLRGPVGLEDSL